MLGGSTWQPVTICSHTNLKVPKLGLCLALAAAAKNMKEVIWAVVVVSLSVSPLRSEKLFPHK